MRHIINLEVENHSGVLARISGLFSARGFNIESISANVTRNPAVTKIVITTLTTPETITKVVKQLNRLVDVLEVHRIRRGQAIWREMILARIPFMDGKEAALQNLLDSRSGKIVSRDTVSAIVEFTGDREAIEEILSSLEALGMEDLIRSGVVALERDKAGT